MIQKTLIIIGVLFLLVGLLYPFLRDIIIPLKASSLARMFDPDPKTNRKFRAHPCPSCGDNTTKKKYCNMCILEREKKTRPDEER